MTVGVLLECMVLLGLSVLQGASFLCCGWQTVVRLWWSFTAF